MPLYSLCLFSKLLQEPTCPSHFVFLTVCVCVRKRCRVRALLCLVYSHRANKYLMCFSNPDGRGWHRVNNGEENISSSLSSIVAFSPCHCQCLCLSFESFIFDILLSSFKTPPSSSLNSLFLPAILPSLSSFEETEKAVTTERLDVKKVAELSFARLFGHLCCQFVSVSLWGSCLCVGLSLARCAGCRPRLRSKP